MANGGSTGLTVQEVVVEFGGLVALDHVSLEAHRGEIVGVIGPNGAGKTTLFNVICGFVRPGGGTVSFDSHGLGHHRPHDLAKLGIVRTLQGVGLCGGLSVLENVLLGAQPHVRADFVSALVGGWRSSREEIRLRQRALDLLAEMHIDQYAAAYPRTLSYGIQKRTALARALMAQPTLLLLDEPAGGLSSEDLDELGRLLRSFRDRMGVLLVEHHMDLVMSICDRLVVLNFGRVIAAGSPEQIRADPEVTTAYLGEDVRRLTGPRGFGEIGA